MDAVRWRGAVDSPAEVQMSSSRELICIGRGIRISRAVEMEFAMDIATTRFGRLEVNEERKRGGSEAE